MTIPLQLNVQEDPSSGLRIEPNVLFLRSVPHHISTTRSLDFKQKLIHNLQGKDSS